MRRLLLPALVSFLSLRAVAAPAPYTRQQFVAALTQDVAAHFNAAGDLQLELLRPWSASGFAADAKLAVLEYPATLNSAMLLRCRLGDEAPGSDFTLVVRASLWADGWAAREPIATGASFDPSLLETRRVDLLRERDVLPATAGGRAFSFARPVSAGRMLTWRDIARRPLVHKGDLVEVVATDGTLAVTMKARALDNGVEGDTVTLRNPESHRDFAAVVVDENHVKVRF